MASRSNSLAVRALRTGNVAGWRDGPSRGRRAAWERTENQAVASPVENLRQRKLVARAFSAGVSFRLEHIAAAELPPGKGVAPVTTGAREQVAASKGFRAGKLVARVLARSGDDDRGP
jgi:hypothetical protein